MGMQHVEDMLLKFGFAGSDALKGIRTINKELEKTVKLLEKVKKARVTAVNASTLGSGAAGAKSTTITAAERLERANAKALQRQRDRNARFDSTASMLNIAGRDPKKAARLMADFRRANAAGNIGAMNQIRNQARIINSQMRSSELSSERIARNFETAATAFVGVNGAIATIRGMSEFLGKIAEVNNEMTQIKSLALIGAGNEAGAAKDMEYSKSVAQRLGVDLVGAAKGYAQVKVSARDVLSESESKKLFESMMEISSAFGLSAADTKSSIKAITQMLNKGQIHAEELKGQLAERVLGAVQMGAKAMNLTVPELLAEMKRGNVSAQEFLVPLTEELRKAARTGGALDIAVKSLASEKQRYENSKKLALDEIGRNGVVQKQADLYKKMVAILDNSSEAKEALASISRGSLVAFESAINAATIAVNGFSSGYNSYREKLVESGLTEDEADVVALATTVAGLAFGLRVLAKWVFRTGSVVGTTTGVLSRFGGILSRITGLPGLAALAGVAATGAAYDMYKEYNDPSSPSYTPPETLADRFSPVSTKDFEEPSKPVEVKVYVDGLKAQIQRNQEENNFHSTIPGG